MCTHTGNECMHVTMEALSAYIGENAVQTENSLNARVVPDKGGTVSYIVQEARDVGRSLAAPKVSKDSAGG